MRQTTSSGTARGKMLIRNDWQGLNEDHDQAPLAANAFFLQAAFADINIDKNRSVYFWSGKRLTDLIASRRLLFIATREKS